MRDFSKEELQVIVTDLKHILSCVSLDEKKKQLRLSIIHKSEQGISEEIYKTGEVVPGSGRFPIDDIIDEAKKKGKK